MIIPSITQLRTARQALGLSQRELGVAVGVSRQTINDLEVGASDPRLSTLAAVEAELSRRGAVWHLDGRSVTISAKSDVQPKTS